MILSQKDLDVYGVRATARTMTFMGKTFVPGQSFAKRLRSTAIAIAQQNIDRGRPSFLVDFDTHITVWTQYQARQAVRSGPQKLKSQEVTKANPVLAKQKRLDAEPPRPAVPLKYRGQSIASSSSPSIAADSADFTNNLTYRGRAVTNSESSGTNPSDWTVLNGQYSSLPDHASTAQRLMQYRGQWVNPDGNSDAS